MAANIRFATEADIPVILEFIHALAAYENMEDQVIVTPAVSYTHLTLPTILLV